ncbi:unnamed protein product, partial [Adineta ricciae]
PTTVSSTTSTSSTTTAPPGEYSYKTIYIFLCTQKVSTLLKSVGVAVGSSVRPFIR